MRAWKVLFLGHYSFAGRKASVTYLKDEPATAPKWLAEKGYHLLAFDTLKNAKEFATDFLEKNGLTIWEVEGEDNWVTIWEVEGEDQILPLPPIAYIDFLAQGELILAKNRNWPKGTLMFKKITLIKRIV